ncbi:MAG TPA: tetratricopeptide repeat protein [Acidobacteriota bacterium]|jgi:tetratricopeptide (TPR) repeat protein
MTGNRIDLLKTFVEKNPNDPFSHYGLAMEYVRHDRLEDALRIYTYLIEKHPDYVPTYYQAGMAFQTAGDIEQAKKTFRDGMSIAQRLGNVHARDELEKALAQLEA